MNPRTRGPVNPRTRGPGYIAFISPIVWRSAIVAPVRKGGRADQFTNYRPISLLCSCHKVCVRLVLKRLLPHVDPLLDRSQAGFRRGAEAQVCSLPKTLRLRPHHHTFCAFVGARKAFDVAWRDAVLLNRAPAGVSGGLWSVVADLVTDTTARVSVNGSFSAFWAHRCSTCCLMPSPQLYVLVLHWVIGL